MEEKEIKVRILADLSVNEIKRIIEKIFEIEFKNTRKDVDVYYDLENNFFFNLNHSLRIRNNHEITYKALFHIPERKSNPWFVLEKNYKLPVSGKNFINLLNLANINFNFKIPEIVNFSKLKNILKELNLEKKIIIKKTRWSENNKNYTIFIDSVDKLGLFVEIEVKNDSFLNFFRNKLSLRFEEIRHGYTSLYAKEVLRIKIPDFESNFRNNPDWNFLGDQKDVVRKIIDNQKI